MKFFLACTSCCLIAFAVYAQTNPSSEWTSFHSRGIEEYFKGNYTESIKLFLRAKEISAQNGQLNPEYARSCNSLGNAYFAAGLINQALVNYLEALRLREQIIGKQTRDYAVTQYNLGRLYRLSGELQKAEVALLEARDIFFQVKGKNDLEYSDCLINLSIVYWQLNEVNKSETYLQDALTIKENVLAADSVALGNQYYQIGYAHWESSYYKRAAYFLAKARNIRERFLGKQSAEYCYTINMLANTYMAEGSFAQSENFYLELTDLWKGNAGDSSIQYLKALGDLAGLYKAMEWYEKSAVVYDQVIALKKRFYGIQSLTLAETLERKGSLSYTLGDFGTAEKELQMGYEIIKDVPDYQILKATLVDDLGSLYMLLGAYTKAEAYLLTASEIRREVSGKNTYDYVSSLNNLALLYQKVGRYTLSDSLYNEAIDIARHAMPQEVYLYLNLVSNLGTLYHDKGLLVLAEEQYLIVRNAEQSKSERTILYGQACGNLADIYFQTNRKEESLRIALEALSVYQKIYGENHPQCIELLNNVALTYYEMNQYEEGYTLYKQMNDKIFLQIDRYFPFMSAKEREDFYQLVQKKFEFFNSLVLFEKQKPLDGPGQLLNNQLVIKGLLFNTENKIRNRVFESEDDSLKEDYLNWRTMRNQLANEYKSVEGEAKAKELEAGINVLEKKLAAQLGFSNNKNALYSWRDIQSNLLKDEAVVTLVRFRKYGTAQIVTDSSNASLPQYTVKGWTDTVYYAALIVVKGIDQPAVVVLKNGNDLEGKFIMNYKNRIRFKLTDTLSYGIYWKPIHEALLKLNKRIKIIHVSPDGVYNLINLATLFDPSEGRFLQDKTDFRLIINPGDLIKGRMHAASNNITRASLIGNPDFMLGDQMLTTEEPENVTIATDSIQRAFDGGQITSLPGTKAEIEEIALLLKQKDVVTAEFVGKNAREDSVESLHNQHVVHIATHGFFLQDVSKGQKFAGFDSQTFLENPLLRSGLLLAGSQNSINGKRNDYSDDGILTAFEAMNMDLTKTDLVVLSACETGLGEIRNGEGVYGLQRAFQTAGAKSVLMSLWKVDDEATRELMTSFYRNWLKSGNKRNAFNKAQAAIRTKYKHPYYWGAFVLVGE